MIILRAMLCHVIVDRKMHACVRKVLDLISQINLHVIQSQWTRQDRDHWPVSHENIQSVFADLKKEGKQKFMELRTKARTFTL